MHSKKSVLSGRLLCPACASYASGIILCAFFNLPVLAVLAAITAFLTAACLRKLPHLFIVFICCISFSGGVLQFQLAEHNNTLFTEKYTGRYVTVEGKITEVTATDDGRQSIIISADSISAVGKTENKRFSACVYTDSEKKFSACDKVSFSTLFRPQKMSSIHAFDYDRYRLTKGISASFTIDSGKISVSDGNPDFSAKLKMFSSALSDKLRNSMGGDSGDVAAAILLGDRSGFSDRLSDTFTKSGISHIVAVSGMHLSILTAFFFLIAGKTGLHYKLRNIFGIIIVLIYMAVTGFSPSVIRAGIMLICTLSAAILDRKEDLATNFFLSAAIILFFNPYTIYSASFLLSYTALAGILIFTKPMLSKMPGFIPQRISLVIVSTLAASVFTTPVLLYLFNGISVLSLVTNLLVVPLVSSVFISSLFALIALLIFPAVGNLVAIIPKILIEIILFIARYISAVPFSYIHVRTPSFAEMIVFSILTLLLYAFLTGRKTGKTGYAAFCAVITISVISFANSMLTYSVTFFDIGQGDCILIRSPGGHSYLIDTGANDNTTVSALKSAGVNHLDAIFISHSDSDHSGALDEVLRNVRTDKVILPNYDVTGEKISDLVKIATESGTDVEFSDSFKSFNLSGINIDAVWPHPGIKCDDENSGSMVLAADIAGNRFLFTGDIDSAAESDIIKSGEIIYADVLKVAHHGSDTSSSYAFLKKVSADYSVISAGRSNSYGHPHEDILLRLKQTGSEILRTDISGDITFKIDLFGNMRVSYETN